MMDDQTDKSIEEVLESWDDVGDIPCTNKECVFQNGECAILACGGYTTRK